MINFEEELKKFKPSLEIDDTETAIVKDHQNDMVDLMIELSRNYKDNN